MKKNWIVGPQLLPKDLKLMWMTMKLIGLLVFVGTMAVSASSYSQKTKIDLRVQNVSVSEILQTIEKNTKFIFIYDAGLIEAIEPRSISVRSQPVETILDELFRDTGVGYSIDDRQVFLYQKEEIPGLVPVEVQGVTEQPQKKEISGSVKDENGNPLPGVSVVLKGTTTGTVTDAAGNYTFQVPLNAQTLAFSFVGMKSQEIQIGNKTVINVVMAEETMGIEEVVAIGYGTVKRKDLTGPVSSVSGQALKDIPVTSASQAIAGRMPGVQVTRTEGSPDAEIKIRVRGGGSLTQDNSPLFIVDGFPVNNINDIAPTDIESIDVLKDASSTAIYGARGANGVILITTKSGGEGKGKVSYNTYFGVKEITKILDVLDPYEYVLWQYERFNTTVGFQSRYGDFRDYDLYKQMEGTNWQEKCLGETGTSMYHNISASGGTKNNKYQISLTRNDEKEIMVGSGFSRTNFSIRTSHSINNWLSVELNTRLSDTYIKGAGTSANHRLFHMVMFRPVNGLVDFTDADDAIELSNMILDPYKQTIDDYKRNKQLNFYFNGNLIIKISKNLNYRLEYGSMYGGNTSDQFYGTNNGSTYLYGWSPMASITKTDIRSYRLANILNYSKRNFLPGSNMNVTLGQELNSYAYKALVMSSKYFSKLITPESALINMGLGTADPNKTSEAPDNNVSSFFGRVNYDYKGKYLASATFRADGSSKFAPGNQWGYFPSAGLAWRIIEEGFLGSVKNKLSDLKLRASFGMAGNNRISDDAWKKTFYLTTGGLFADGDGENAKATAIMNPNSILSNPELKWETTITRNLGVDIGFFKQRLSGSVELYKNTTKDLLVKATVPASSGYKSQWQNIGQTSNKGIEIVLNGTIIEKKDFRLSASFNIGINRNHIDKLGEVKSWEELNILYGNLTLTDFYVNEGGQIGQMYGFVTDGMYSFDDFYYANGTYTLKEGVANDNSIVYPARFMPGALKLKDQNGDFVIDNNDKVIVGNANPKHTGGFNLTAQMKGFDISTFFNWVYGNDIYNANKSFYTSTYSSTPNMNSLEIMNYSNRFSYLNKETGKIVMDPIELAEINEDATIWANGNMYQPLHSWAIEDGSFLRLNTVTIGYTLPQSWLKKLSINKLRVYGSAYNVWTWTNYTGFDPEVDTQRSTPLTPGVDWNAYPKSRSFNIGLNVEF